MPTWNSTGPEDDFDRIADWQPDAPAVPRDREVDTTAAIPAGMTRVTNLAARLVDIELDVPGDRAAAEIREIRETACHAIALPCVSPGRGKSVHRLG